MTGPPGYQISFTSCEKSQNNECLLFYIMSHKWGLPHPMYTVYQMSVYLIIFQLLHV